MHLTIALESPWLSAPGATGWPPTWLSPHGDASSPRWASPSSARRPSRRCTCISARPRVTGARISLALAGGVTLVITAVRVWVVALGMDANDVSRVELGPDVRLGAARVVPNRDIADYLAKLFDGFSENPAGSAEILYFDAPLADAGDWNEENAHEPEPPRLRRCSSACPSSAAPRQAQGGRRPCRDGNSDWAAGRSSTLLSPEWLHFPRRLHRLPPEAGACGG